MGSSTWLWSILVVVIVIVGGTLVVRTVRANNAKLFASESTPERARAASSRLTEEQHRAVHRQLATGAVIGAAQEIARATGRGARDSLLDAHAMSRFPQEWVDPTDGENPEVADAGRSDAAAEDSSTGPSPDEARMVGGFDGLDAMVGPGRDDPSPSSAAAPDDEWVVPEGWEDAYGGDSAGERHMEFTHHDGSELRRFSTQDLPDAERDQLMSQLRDGDMAAAARTIAAQVGLEPEEVENALRANHDSGHDRVDGIAVRFDRGDGTSVDFSTEDLEQSERELFVSALRAGDLVSAAQVVSRHTGISPEQALGLLQAFRRGA